MNKYGKVKILVLILFALFFMASINLSALTENSINRINLKAKKKTDRYIEMNIVVDASIEKVFELWTTVEGCRKFFGTDAVIDLNTGTYEIYFLPRTNPKSNINSSMGANLLQIEKNKNLAFEWTMPPFAREFNVKPFPTWVEVTFNALKNNPDRTRLRLIHHGFKRGGKWDKAYEFFVRGWANILFRLDLLCSQKNAE